jgi:hypothetical protein
MALVKSTMIPGDFGWALYRLRSGERVRRSGWNGKGMWLILVAVNDWSVSEAFVDGEPHELLPWIGMKTADEKFVPWLASQTDMLAEDWEIAT